MIDLGFGAVAGMKIGGTGLDCHDPDVGGQERIEGDEEAFGLEEGVGIKVGDLSFGMDACVGSPRACETCRMS